MGESKAGGIQNYCCRRVLQGAKTREHTLYLGVDATDIHSPPKHHYKPNVAIRCYSWHLKDERFTKAKGKHSNSLAMATVVEIILRVI